ncbi:MAG: hypothetical protein AAGD38_12905 [Acidobacteriota bacterium]
MPFEPPTATDEDRAELAHAGLCASCTHLQPLRSARSLFVRCGLSDRDERFPRYPGLPRLECSGYEPITRRE